MLVSDLINSKIRNITMPLDKASEVSGVSKSTLWRAKCGVSLVNMETVRRLEESRVIDLNESFDERLKEKDAKISSLKRDNDLLLTNEAKRTEILYKVLNSLKKLHVAGVEGFEQRKIIIDTLTKELKR